MLLLSCLFLSACASSTSSTGVAGTPTAAEALDLWHTAASRADEQAYFDLMTEDAVFLGTDASERWEKAAFRAYAHPHFSKGKGWTFTPRNRNVQFAENGRTAWFDEMLDSSKYGVCRGTGVLVRTRDGWKIQQYHLTIPIPNDLADEFVARIRKAS